MPWFLVAYRRTCGSCGLELLPAKDDRPADLCYRTRTGAHRCQECGEAASGLCLLDYDAVPLERPGGDGYTPPAPTLEGTRSSFSSVSEPMTPAQLKARQDRHARAIQRWKDRKTHDR